MYYTNIHFTLQFTARRLMDLELKHKAQKNGSVSDS